MAARGQIFVSGAWRLDVGGRELRAHGAPVPIGNRAFEILVVLVQAAGRVVTKDEIIARIWPGAVVAETSLQAHISAVRRALGPLPAQDRLGPWLQPRWRLDSRRRRTARSRSACGRTRLSPAVC